MDGYTLLNERPEAQALERLSSDISRRCLYGSWIDGVEYTLWQRLSDGPGDFGDDAVTNAEVFELRRLSAAIDGWLVWRNTEDENATKAYLESGPYVVPMSEWRPLFARWKEATHGPR